MENKSLPDPYMGFWATLPKPFFSVAPMADVTDAAFRQIIARYSRHGEVGGGPDVLWTEFVSADGLGSPGREVLKRDLLFTPGEHPLVAQLFSANTDSMRDAARLCAELGFDGIDINMGCPDRSIEKQGCGAAMINTPDIAVAIIRAAKEGVQLAGKELPISVKTRVGYNREVIDTWIPVLLNEGIAALTIHARTRKEMSKVPADWSRIKRVVKLRDALGVQTKIIGNGDIADIADGIAKANDTGADGIMIGRAVFGNPWLFDRNRIILSRAKLGSPLLSRFLPRSWIKKIQGDSKYTVSEVLLDEKLRVLVEHAELFEELLGDIKSFAIMKKHFKAYIQGFTGAKELRVQLMEEGNSAKEVKSIIDQYLKSR